MMRPSKDVHGRPPRPQVDRREVHPNVCTPRAGVRVRTRVDGTRDAVVELGGQGPFALSPRFEVSPSPSCPLMFHPQHLMVASSCGENQPKITNRKIVCFEIWGESFAKVPQSR